MRSLGCIEPLASQVFPPPLLGRENLCSVWHCFPSVPMDQIITHAFSYAGHLPLSSDFQVGDDDALHLKHRFGDALERRRIGA